MFARSSRRLLAASAGLTLLALSALSSAAPAGAVIAPESVRVSVPAFPANLVLAHSCAYVPDPCRTGGAQVTAVQRALVRRGYVIGRHTTGLYGSTTAAAVKRYKNAHPGLGPTNRVGPRTYASITGGVASAPTAPTPTTPTTSPRFTSIEQCLSIGGVDPTTTSAARSSQSARRAVTRGQFVRSRMGCKVVVRESGGDCRIVSGSGKYLGKWQLDMDEWPRLGGLAFAGRPHLATCAEQDIVAYRNWVDRGWTPWTTAY